MIDKMTLLHKFEDVNVWLGTISYLPGTELLKVTDDAKGKASQHFKIPFELVGEIMRLEEKNYNEEKEQIITFYFEYLRNTQAFRQWFATQ